MARPPEAAGARSLEAAREIARAPGIAGTPAQARPRRARSRCRSAGGASCALLHGAIGAALIAQRQSEAERAALAVSGGLRPHAAAVRSNDAVAEVQAEPSSGHVSRRFRPIPPAEQLRQLGAIEADSLVPHPHRPAPLVAPHPHPHGPALAPILHP